ncbi:MAG: uroporphyrinogen-III C-methyltransferase [Solirubrobacterales bacterium]|nr:uroporphyrinogen-III C-methyltransferase [Solirubrobacterales bacterium]
MTALPGTVYLVGGGPGDPGLMTVRAVELLATADVIIHDRLIPSGCLDLVRHDAKVISVGKEGGGPSTPQDEINDLLVEHGKAGSSVVRLKGGDPFVFGRGGEEALVLRNAGISFEVVPAVTSGIAAPASAGIPVTQRGMSSAVALVTGHEDPTKPETALDYAGLAVFPGTLVLYMGVKRLDAITESLIAAGRRADEPAALIERGTMPGQKTVVATLETLAAAGQEAGIKAPAITLIGDVASLQPDLHWVERRPLHGRRIAVTRARAQAGSLSARLTALGAQTVEVPTIRTEPVDVGTPLDPAGTDLLCITSTNSVDLLFDRMAAGGLDARALAGVTVAAIGPGTARALEARGIRADIVPQRSIAEALVEAIAASGRGYPKAMIVRAEEARNVLDEALAAQGSEVSVVVLYRTVREDLTDSEQSALATADTITFTSASTVRHLLDAIGGPAGLGETKPQLASIGPITTAELEAHGLSADIEAVEHDIDGLIAALTADAAR